MGDGRRRRRISNRSRSKKKQPRLGKVTDESGYGGWDESKDTEWYYDDAEGGYYNEAQVIWKNPEMIKVFASAGGPTEEKTFPLKSESDVDDIIKFVEAEAGLREGSPDEDEGDDEPEEDVEDEELDDPKAKKGKGKIPPQLKMHIQKKKKSKLDEEIERLEKILFEELTDVPLEEYNEDRYPPMEEEDDDFDIAEHHWRCHCHDCVEAWADYEPDADEIVKGWREDRISA